jgi:aerobic carbon-monoxide dehydrogenase medium subunit
MKPAPFDYHAPRTLDEATSLMATLDNAKLLAGGQSLVPMMNFRYVIADHIVDLSKVADLAGIGVADGKMRIGAMTRQRELEFSSEVAERCPLLTEALAHVGHRQTRNRGTIGGSLSHADPAAELPAICAVHDATIEITSLRGTRKIPFNEFALTFMTTSIEPDEIVTGIEFALWPQGHGYGFQEFARRRGDFAIAGAAVLVELNADRTVKRASIVLCGVATVPMRIAAAEAALVGKPLDANAVHAAAAATGTLTAISDIHASAEYRLHLAGVLVFRALRDAAERCGSPI